MHSLIFVKIEIDTETTKDPKNTLDTSKLESDSEFEVGDSKSIYTISSCNDTRVTY
jgi:hypothetical protein